MARGPDTDLPLQPNLAVRLGVTAVLLALIALTSLQSYVLFHTLAEVVFAVVAFTVLIMAWTLRGFLDDDFPVFIGLGLAAAAVLHLVHMLDFPGLDLIERSTDPPTQLWLVARGITAVTFVAAPFVLGRRLPVRLVALALVAVDALALLTIYLWKVFPTAYALPQGLTTFTKVAEYAICALFALAIVLLWRRRRLIPGDGFALLVASLVAGIVSELFFTTYVRPHTWPNHIGHLFLVLSAILVYLALVEDTLARPHTLAVRSLHEARRLHERLELSLLPTLPVSHPGLALIAHYQPGEHRLELGGDFIDMVELETGGVAVICGDVSGHGPDAAALGAMLRVSWEALVLSGADSATVVRALREVVRRERRVEETYATVCLGWIEPEPEQVKLLNMGHPPPLLINEDVARLATTPLPPIGTVDLPVEEPTAVRLHGDWKLFFYTDGLIEGRATPRSEERFGEERLIQALREISCSGLDRACLGAMIADIEKAGGEAFNDDVTVVVIGRSATVEGDLPAEASKDDIGAAAGGTGAAAERSA